MALDATWKVGLGWGIVIALLTVAGVWAGARLDSTTPLGLGFLVWLAFVAWTERGVK